MQTEIEKLKYPVGKFTPPVAYSEDAVKNAINQLAVLPAYLEETVKGLSSRELLFCYREGSWNIKQIVHHLADSHLNFHIRLRLTLTEETPVVKPYDENAWASLIDANSEELSSSMHILKGVHMRAVELLRTLNEKDFQREYHHPEYKKNFNLFWLLNLYAWHGKHHAAQIKTALQHKF